MARLARDPEVEALIDAYRADLIAAGHFAENEVTSPARAFLLRIGGPSGWSRLSLEQQFEVSRGARERAGDVDDHRRPRAAQTRVPGAWLSAARQGRGVGPRRVSPAVHARFVHTFKFDQQSGMISEGRVLVTVDEQVGSPDGLTVDRNGDIWVAIYGGGRVQRYSAEGELRQELIVPAAQSTSSRVRWPGAQSALCARPRPRAGATYSVRLSRRPGSCTGSRPIPPDCPQRSFALSRPGGQR